MLTAIVILLAALYIHVLIRDFSADWRREREEIIKKYYPAYGKSTAPRS